MMLDDKVPVWRDKVRDDRALTCYWLSDNTSEGGYSASRVWLTIETEATESKTMDKEGFRCSDVEYDDDKCHTTTRIHCDASIYLIPQSIKSNFQIFVL